MFCRFKSILSRTHNYDYNQIKFTLSEFFTSVRTPECVIKYVAKLSKYHIEKRESINFKQITTKTFKYITYFIVMIYLNKNDNG